MKRNKIFHWAICSLLLLGACKKNELSTLSTVDATGAQVKVFFTSAYQKNPTYQISINDVRVSNLLGATSTPTPFPGGGLNTGGGSTADYLEVASGNVKFTVATPKVGTNIDSNVLATTTPALENGKKYSLYFTDTAANTTAVLVEDSLVRADSGFAKFKFVNLMPNQPALDLYIGTVKVASNIPYKGVSPSFTVPTNNASTSWAVRTVGGTATIGIAYASASTLANQRVFTVIARGYSTITTTSDFRRGTVSFIYNQ